MRSEHNHRAIGPSLVYDAERIEYLGLRRSTTLAGQFFNFVVGQKHHGHSLLANSSWSTGTPAFTGQQQPVPLQICVLAFPHLVKLPAEALAAVLAQKRHTANSSKVFHDPYYNEPWLYHRITRATFWTTTLKRLGIRHRRTYNTRHTYATIGLMAGVNPAFMARQLGHSLEMFFKVYAKWIDGQHDDREMAKIETAINSF